MQTSQQNMASLVAEFAGLSRKLLAVEDSTARGVILEQLRVLLRELRAAAKAQEEDFRQ